LREQKNPESRIRPPIRIRQESASKKAVAAGSGFKPTGDFHSGFRLLNPGFFAGLRAKVISC